MRKRLFALLLGLVMALSLLPLTAAFADSRIPISTVAGSSDNYESLCVYGTPVTTKPTITVTSGSPAYFNINDGNGFWQKWDGSNWVGQTSGIITSGKWRFGCQVRIDGSSGTTHVLQSPVKITVNGVTWAAAATASQYDAFSCAWAYSPEFTVAEPANLTFNKFANIGNSYANRPITAFSCADKAEGGVKPYTFSKTSGPSWLQVSADGMISGTPTVVGSNASLVVRVTDSRGTYKEVSVTVAATKLNPNDRTKISAVAGTSSDLNRLAVVGTPVTTKPTITVTAGAPAFFNINSGNGHWQKWNGSSWENQYSGTITPGKWRFRCQVRIDGSGGETSVLQNPVTVTVNGFSWTVEGSTTVTDSHSFAWVYSPEFTVNEFRITKQPSNASCTVGGSMTFSVEAIGAERYAWFVCDSDDDQPYDNTYVRNYAALSDTTQPSITISPKDTWLNGKAIYCELYDANGRYIDMTDVVYMEVTAASLACDLTDDGKTDADDLTALLRHVAKIELLDNSLLDLANVDGLGGINAADVTYLAQMLQSNP